VVGAGRYTLEVFLDPKKTENPVWQIKDVGSGTYYINVTSGDPDFYFGANYYLSL
jgi:hypothetical protein